VVLLGRDLECARIDDLLQAARRGVSGVLVIQGEPGVGKSTLLRYAGERATGMQTVATRGIESESELPFAGLADLVRPLALSLRGIPAAQSAALSSAVAVGPPVAADRFAACAATLSLLASAGESQPVLVLVDDLQWLDDSSADAILFAARRLALEGVVIVLAVREGETGNLDLSGLPILRVAGLDESAALQLLGQSENAPVSRTVGLRLLQATGGNPLGLLELPHLLTPAQRDGYEPLPDPLPSGPRLEQAFLKRLSGLRPATQRALVVAAAAESSDAATIHRALQLMEIAVDALHPAEAAGLLSADGVHLDFRHPLIRSAIYQAAAPARRREAHAALAQALDAEHVADRRAWHLAAAATEPDETVARALEEAATRSLSRSGYAAASRGFARAAALTPAAESRARRYFAAAHAADLAGQHDAVVSHLDAAASFQPSPALHLEIQRLRAVTETWVRQPMAAHRLLLAEASRADPAMAAILLAEAAIPVFMAGEIPLALRTAQRAYEVATASGRDVPLVVNTIMAEALVLAGEALAASPLVDLSLRLAMTLGPAASREVQYLPFSLVALERYDEARLLIGGAASMARDASAVGILPYVLAILCELEFRTGNWAAAYAAGTESVRLSDETGQRSGSAYGLVCLARVEATQGRDTDSQAHLASATELARTHGLGSIFVYAGSTAGLLELGRGRLEPALVHLENVANLVRSLGGAEPNVVQWQADLVETLLRTGRTVEGEAALQQLERQGEHTGGSWAQAAAARCRGLQARADFETHFARALELHQRRPSPFEIARTQLSFGEVLRRNRRRVEARHHIYEALHAFERLGAEPWAARARAELSATGEKGRQRNLASSRRLTPQELQIALAVAGGATNREAAAGLFLSPKTVEGHLSRIYDKLEVRSRTELVRLFARESSAAELATHAPVLSL
jgi:DNA-binding CsgD family transcriptional regulator